MADLKEHMQRSDLCDPRPHTLALPPSPKVSADLAARTIDVATLREHVQRLEYQMAESQSTLSGGACPVSAIPPQGRPASDAKPGREYGTGGMELLGGAWLGQMGTR